MNEIFVKLLVLSGLSNETIMRISEGESGAINEFHLKQFAELIIRECISKIESKRSSGENSDQWTITRDVCYHDMIEEIRKHFGVK